MRISSNQLELWSFVLCEWWKWIRKADLWLWHKNIC